jgi:SNF2 family DNA or RNA helicase
METIEATIIGNRIYVRAPFEKKDACKRVLGARWAKAEKSWTYPATVDTCHALRTELGPVLTVLPALAEWYAGASARAGAQVALASATDAVLVRLPTVAPRLAATLRPDQRAGVLMMAHGYDGSLLCADVPGLGKTLETIGAVLEADVPGHVLIVCPKLSVKNVWLKELRKWTDEHVYAARGTRANRERVIAAFDADPAERKWLIIVAEMLRIKERPAENDPTGKKKMFDGFEYPPLYAKSWGCVAIDESQKIMGSLTIVKGNLMGKGIKRLPVHPDGRKFAISGTPFGKGGRVQGMFGTLMWLWPKEFTAFWRWAERHFEIEDVRINRFGDTAKKINGLKGGQDGEEFLRTLGPRILRRTKEEVLPWLPPKQWVEVVCEMSPAQVRQYKGLTDDAMIQTTSGGDILVNGVLAELTRAKQLANGVVDVKPDGQVVFTDDSGKLDMFFDKMETRGILDGSGDVKVIVASQFNEFLLPLKNRLDAAGVAYHEITGKTSDSKRDAAMDAFQSDGGARVFVLNSKAGGVSVTLDAADEVHCLDEMWNPEDQDQLEDRAHRASRNHQVTIFYYRSEGTIDTTIGEKVEGKRVQQFNVLDGRRGREYVREMIQYRKPKED